MPCVRYAYMSELARAVDVEREELLLEQVDGVLVDLAHLLEVEQDVLGGIDRAVVVGRDDLDGGKEKGLGVR